MLVMVYTFSNKLVLQKFARVSIPIERLFITDWVLHRTVRWLPCKRITAAEPFTCILRVVDGDVLVLNREFVFYFVLVLTWYKFKTKLFANKTNTLFLCSLKPVNNMNYSRSICMQRLKKYLR